MEKLFVFWLYIIFSFALAFLAYFARSVTMGGALIGGIIASILTIVGGWKFFILLAVFVVFGAAFAKLPHRFSAKSNQHSLRNAFQILATTGVSALALLLTLLFEKDAMAQRGLLLASIVALATSFSDTMSAELGGRYGGTPRKLLFGKQLEVGESGGMTWFGVAIGAASAFGFLYLAKQLQLLPFEKESNLAMLAFLGNLIDSGFGAFLQNRYQCRQCQEKTELPFHCNQKGIRISGVGLTNTGVNGITTFIIALLTFFLYS